MSSHDHSVGVLAFPLADDTAVTVEVNDGVPTLVISTAVAQLRFHPVVASTVTWADMDKAGELCAAVQLYSDYCHWYLHPDS